MVSSYLRAMRHFSRNARLYLVSAGLMGFTVFGGIYSLLRSLYLLRLGYGPEFVGLVSGVALLGWALACLPAGAIGRRLGSRRAMVLGLGLATIGFVLWPLAELIPVDGRAAWLVLIYLFSDVAIAMYDVNSGPFLMDATTSEERDHVFSVMAALWPIAGFLGSLIGGLLPGAFALLLRTTTQDPATFRYPLLMAGASLGAGVVALYLSKERRPAAHPTQASQAAPNALMAAPYRIMAFLGVVVLLGGMGEGAARTFFSVYLDAGLHTPTAFIGTLAAIGQLLAVPAALAMPFAAGRWGHRRVFLWGSAGMAVSLLPLALIPHWAAAGLGYMGMIALVSLTRPAISVYQMEIVSVVWRPKMSGVCTMAIGLSWSVVSLGGGFMIAARGYPSFFLASAVVTGVGAALFGLKQAAAAEPHPSPAS
ncbi:MAG: MFS transporter [Planctomycetes bacterium]|nr:MFS transporter [Planctomycetota bacterium]